MSTRFSQSDISKNIESITTAWKGMHRDLGSRTLLYQVGENCNWSYGITSENTFCFYFESLEQFGCGKQLCTKTIQISEHKKFNESIGQNIWILMFELLELSDISIFGQLMQDLIYESMQYDKDNACVHAVIARFGNWRKMLSNASEHKAEEKGLFGELYVLNGLLEKGLYSSIDVIRAWMGPDYAVQDFKFASNWIEVKAIGSNSFTVKISSIKQLNSTDLGELYVIKADEDEFDENSESVYSLYRKIDEKLKIQSNEADELFNSKLIEFKYMGFVATERTKFAVKGFEKYKVDSSFPRLIFQDDKQAIKSVTYELVLAALQDWRI